MKTLRNIGFSFLFLLILFSGIFLYHAESVSSHVPNSSASDELSQSGEIKNAASDLFLFIEGNSFSQTISQFHRLSTVFILANRIIPLNFNFGNVTYIAVPINFDSPIPIFIRGHALLD